MQIIFLILYTLSQFFVGRIIFRKLFDKVPMLLEFAGSSLLGVFVSVPITYVLSCVFAFTGEPLLWGIIIWFLVFGSWFLVYLRTKSEELRTNFRNQEPGTTVSDIILVLFTVVFSTWIMFKTFHGGDGGQLFVGSNNVFDFGLFIGLVRSMAWGGNIPLMSPFFAGLPLFYHFFFQFWVALWEYSGIPTVWAVNTPSIFSFSALLIVIYYLPQIVLKTGKLVGWISVILTITHSTLTFWYLIFEKGLNVKMLNDIWRLPTYPYAGPYDGSVISIYITLNNYVNQRHLALGIAMGLLLYIVVIRNIEQKKITPIVNVTIGFLTGLLFLWNMAMCILMGALISFLFILYRSWKALLFFLLGCAVILLFSLVPYMPYLLKTFITVNRMVAGTFDTISASVPTWTLVQYLWENLGILPLIIFFGFIVLPKKGKVYVLPFLVLFIIECLLAGVGKRGFDQKFYSFLIIGVNVIAAAGISWLWEKRTTVFYGLTVMILFTVSISGVVDLMAIKNEFAFPLVSKEIIPIISWIKKETSKDAVFVSYSDMIDPVVLAGRKNYFGFFGNVGWRDRSPDVKNIYAGDIDTAQKLGISYILAPNWKKDDFPYSVDTMYYREHRMIVYEDEKYSIFTVRN